MKSIRKNVFETNSSSTHSICITENVMYDDMKTHIDFKMQSFGWEEERYSDAQSKANYLYTALCNNEEYELILSIADILKKNGITCTFENPEDKKYGGDLEYIDHYSCLYKEFREICLNEEALLRYLFSTESFILTGNDNCWNDNVSIDVNYPHIEIYKGN